MKSKRREHAIFQIDAIAADAQNLTVRHQQYVTQMRFGERKQRNDYADERTKHTTQIVQNEQMTTIMRDDQNQMNFVQHDAIQSFVIVQIAKNDEKIVRNDQFQIDQQQRRNSIQSTRNDDEIVHRARHLSFYAATLQILFQNDEKNDDYDHLNAKQQRRHHEQQIFFVVRWHDHQNFFANAYNQQQFVALIQIAWFRVRIEKTLQHRFDDQSVSQFSSNCMQRLKTIVDRIDQRKNERNRRRRRLTMHDESEIVRHFHDETILLLTDFAIRREQNVRHACMQINVVVVMNLMRLHDVRCLSIVHANFERHRNVIEFVMIVWLIQLEIEQIDDVRRVSIETIRDFVQLTRIVVQQSSFQRDDDVSILTRDHVVVRVLKAVQFVLSIEMFRDSRIIVFSKQKFSITRNRLHAIFQKLNEKKHVNKIFDQQMIYVEKKKSNDRSRVETSLRFVIIDDQHHHVMRKKQIAYDFLIASDDFDQFATTNEQFERSQHQHVH